MRKKPLPRMLWLLALYCGVFIVLARLQFPKNEKIPRQPKVKVEKVQPALDPAAFTIPHAKSTSAFNETI